MRAQSLLFILAVAVAATIVALPAGATTAPGESAKIIVKISDKGITIANQGQEARGVIADFEAINLGKKAHDFKLFGKTTPLLKPGKKAVFTVTLGRRGLFPYKSTVDKGKAFRGYFVVY